MALKPFAKVADLQILVPTMDDATATLTLDLVSGAIRAAVGWDVDQVVNAVYTKLIVGTSPFDAEVYTNEGYPSITYFTGRVVLPVMNLTAVSEVKADGVVVPVAEYAFTTAGVVRLNSSPATSIEVTYTAGYVRSPIDEVPSVFRSVALEYAAKFAGNPAGVRSYQLGAAMETFADPGAMRSMVEGDARLDAYRVNLG